VTILMLVSSANTRRFSKQSQRHRFYHTWNVSLHYLVKYCHVFTQWQTIRFLRYPVDCMIVCLAVFVQVQCRLMTDGWTDRQTDINDDSIYRASSNNHRLNTPPSSEVVECLTPAGSQLYKGAHCVRTRHLWR